MRSRENQHFNDETTKEKEIYCYGDAWYLRIGVDVYIYD